MELEKRVAALEAIVMDMTTVGHVRDLMIRALIATHPSPESVKAAFQVLLPESEAALSNDAFAIGLPPATTRQMQTAMAEAAARWLAFFPKPASGAGTPTAG
ncbi:hypothetical protein [Lysobacter enzymogenes]|uniref:hypothetical protein n=1 Tax=Lysobacter enzymogenes TaxID=69 RepID=UPI00111394C0|nr:hypothetical protein [Lysobacter enzymogenes]